MQNFGIGGNEVPSDAFEAILEIPKNRTLLLEKLTDQQPVKPEIVEGLQTIEDVFAHYKPQVKMEFEDLEGGTRREDLEFNNLGDFGTRGITRQSSFLQDISVQKDEHYKIIKQLKSNKVLRNVISDPEKRQALLDAIQAMISELKQTNV